MSQLTRKKITRRFRGTVISSKMQHTVVVKIDRLFKDPKYGKRYKKSKSYPSDTGTFTVLQRGDRVIIEECRPLSKTKRFRVIEKISQ